MNNDKYDTVYIAANCNQCKNVLHWGNNNLICYGSCNSICIYDPEFGSGGEVTKTLAVHSAQVNSVRWLKGTDVSFENEIISGGADGRLILWNIENDKVTHEVLEKSRSNITIVDGLYKNKCRNNAVIICSAIDGKIKIWHRKIPDADQFKIAQILDFGYNIGISLRLSLLDPSINQLLLALSLDDSSIRIYVENDETPELLFNHSLNLKGHEDWVCGLDFISDNSDLLMASSAQDNFIRIWRISKNEHNEENNMHTQFIQTSKWSYKIFLESVLIGHEGWVYSVAWNPVNKTLLSASWDKTMVIWEFDEENKLWLDNIRVGEVGGNTLGFFGAQFGPKGDIMLGYGYHGAFHMWKNQNDTWSPLVSVGGHFKQAVDIGWDPNGSYLFSVSSDQTCRIHAPWPTEKAELTWHEIARPQVHGYDMNSIAIFSKYKFASASEEKVIRVFTVPQNFIENYKRICKVTDEGESKCDDVGVRGASVPSLGLSNKAVYRDDNSEDVKIKNSKEAYPEESHFTAVQLEEPPTEETLLQNTLWPEVRKLYGHGYEVYSLASSNDGNYLASSCKSTTQEHSAILLWDTKEWKQIQKLTSHTLTVTQIEFSPDSQKILSVSRDRRWSIFEKNQSDGKFELKATTNKTTGVHTRIIWCCTWTFDSKFFSTGSRDGKLAIWMKNPDKPNEDVLGHYLQASIHLSLPKDSITAVATAPNLIKNYYLFCLGLESGILLFYKWNLETKWEKCLEMNESVSHHLTVRRIRFRPTFGEAGHKKRDEKILQVASCSSDYSIKIFNLFIEKL